MPTLTPVLYGRVLFGRTLYSVNSDQNLPVPIWVEIEQNVTSGIWTEIAQ